MEAECPCQICNGHISFEVEAAGQMIVCPHCGMETLLFVPPKDRKVVNPPASSPAKRPEVNHLPTTLKCFCTRCGLGIEYEAIQAGKVFECPHCGTAMPLPDQKINLTADTPVSEPIWFGCEASTIEVQLMSGVILKFKAVRLYDAAELNDLSAQKAYAAEMLDGVKSPYVPFGDIAWVLFASKITGMLEKTLSREAAQKGIALVQQIAERERKLRQRVNFFPVGQIQEIENPIPTLWTVLRAGSRFVHSGEEFITVTDAEGVVKRIRWDCVESYEYQANT